MKLIFKDLILQLLPPIHKQLNYFTMKSIIKWGLIVSFLSISTDATSQDVGDLVRLKVGPLVKKVESIYEHVEVHKSAKILSTKTQFIVISKTEDEVKLRAAPNYEKRLTKEYKDDYKEKYSTDPVDFVDIYNDKIYTVSKSDFDLAAYSVEINSPVSLGIITLPFKARPQGSFSFDTEFNINTTVNIRLWPTNNFTFNLQLGAGIGSVNLNSNNAPGVSEEEAQDVSTLTFLSGLMVEHKRLQIGLYFGTDHINNQSNFRWESNGNLWLAFGVGYDVFDIVKSDKKNKQ